MDTSVQKQEKQLVIENPNKLLEIALNQNADIDKLEKLINMQVEWEKREARKAFYEAMSAFQMECPVIQKIDKVDFTNSQGKRTFYNFAGFDSIILQLRELISKHGFSYRFEHKMENGKIHVGCIVTHRDGHSESTWMEGVPDSSGNKNPIQQNGSTFTFLKRYTFTGAFGIATSDKDDDARSAAPEKQTDDQVKVAHDKYMESLGKAKELIGSKVPKSYEPNNWKAPFDQRNVQMYQSAEQRLTALVNKNLDSQ